MARSDNVCQRGSPFRLGPSRTVGATLDRFRIAAGLHSSIGGRGVYRPIDPAEKSAGFVLIHQLHGGSRSGADLLPKMGPEESRRLRVWGGGGTYNPAIPPRGHPKKEKSTHWPWGGRISARTCCT